jgi:hypothetical protein
LGDPGGLRLLPATVRRNYSLPNDELSMLDAV